MNEFLSFEEQNEILRKLLKKEREISAQLVEVCGLHLDFGSDETIFVSNFQNNVIHTMPGNGYRGLLDAILWLNQYKAKKLAKIAAGII